MGRGSKIKLASGIPGNPRITFGSNSLEEKNFESTINNVKQVLLNKAKSDDTKKLIGELYRDNATIGDGGTADAVRHEIKDGVKVGGKSHIIKAQQRIKQINNMLKRNPNHSDKELLIDLKNNLEDALKGR
jgi:hypothetical protein